MHLKRDAGARAHQVGEKCWKEKHLKYTWRGFQFRFRLVIGGGGVDVWRKPFSLTSVERRQLRRWAMIGGQTHSRKCKPLFFSPHTPFIVQKDVSDRVSRLTSFFPSPHLLLAAISYFLDSGTVVKWVKRQRLKEKCEWESFDLLLIYHQGANTFAGLLQGSYFAQCFMASGVDWTQWRLFEQSIVNQVYVLW